MVFRRTPPPARIVTVERLESFTAEQLVIIQTTPAGVAEILAAARAHEPLTLRSPEARDVTWLPVKKATKQPVLDPNRGWLLPLTPTTAHELSTTVRAEPGQWELSTINIAIIAIASSFPSQ